jgi:serine/threonine protein kinase
MANSDPTRSRSASTATANILSRTQGFMRRHLWVWPLIAALILAFIGLWVRARMEGAMKSQIAGNLQTILAANTEALRAWSTTVKGHVEQAAEDTRVRELVSGLVLRGGQEGVLQSTMLNAPELAALRTLLKPMLDRHGFNGFVVLDTNVAVLAATRDHIVGLKSPPGYAEHFQTAFSGTSVVTRPFPSVALLVDERGQVRSGVPTMFAAAPVRSADGVIVAAFGFRMEPEKNFTRILATARSGRSGETYAFDRKGLMLSQSRFDDQLKRLSLIPDSDDARSIIMLELRDPLLDLTRGKPSPKRRAELPFTRAVAESIADRPGVDVEGYRDYRGVPVVGAWTWLPDFDLGLVTEMDVAEAFAPLRIMRMGFFFMFGLLGLAAGAIFVLMRLANRWQHSARKAALKARQLGQYALDEKIGAGAFGTVFRGHHALMRRPVAVKLLDAGQATENTIARFEREVQLTCQLTHPNTIALYDYGRTPEGLFYYAMEFLEGLSLDALVGKYGPLPEGRVIHILRQVCASLAEAHGKGLVHRDIKPHNIFLTRRGGIPDFVKVLDFGLVKARNLEGQLELTGANTTLGTPLYMSPEAVERPDSVDASSDLYSLGAVGYYLLTAEPVFSGTTIGEILVQHVKATPERPSSILGHPLSADLEELLMRCLAKEPAERPADARRMESDLSECSAASQWSCDAAEDWWSRRDAATADQTAVVEQRHPSPDQKDFASAGAARSEAGRR